MSKHEVRQAMERLDKLMTAEEKRRETANTEISAAHTALTALIKDGGTSGDVVEDFMACCGRGFPEAQRERVTKQLREVQNAVAANSVQPALIVTTEVVEAKHTGSLRTFGGVSTSYQMGSLSGDKIVLDIEHANWRLPTARYVSMSDSGPSFIHEGPMGAEDIAMLSWYGFHSVRDRAVEFIIGMADIDSYFAKIEKHETLARLVKSIFLSIEAFPKNAARLREEK